MALDENPTDAETRIYWQDQQIIQNAQTYVTVVALVSLTPDIKHAQPGRSRDMLQGIALAQKEFNAAHGDLKLCMLIANVDASQQNASLHTVVGQIITAKHDNVYQHIVGVVGWPFDGQKDELARLTNNDLAVISPIAPDNDLLNTPFFFSVAPSLQAEAEVAARYVKAKWPGEPVLLLEDPSDAYSQQLGEAFDQALGATIIKEKVSYIVGQTCHGDGICNTLNPYLSDNMVIYFAGYPDDARYILKRTHDFQHIHVIGGDVLSQLVNTSKQFAGAFNDLYYTAFAFHIGVHDQNFPQDPQSNFTQDYKMLFNAQNASPLCSYTCVIASNDTILAYDVTLVFEQAALKVRKGSRLPTAVGISSSLEASAFLPIQGASGSLAFASDGTLARNNAVLLLWLNQQGFTQKLSLP